MPCPVCFTGWNTFSSVMDLSHSSHRGRVHPFFHCQLSSQFMHWRQSSRFDFVHSRAVNSFRPLIPLNAFRIAFFTCWALRLRFSATFIILPWLCSFLRAPPLGMYFCLRFSRITFTFTGFGCEAFFFFFWGSATQSAVGSKVSDHFGGWEDDGKQAARAFFSTTVGFRILLTMLSARHVYSLVCRYWKVN